MQATHHRRTPSTLPTFEPMLPTQAARPPRPTHRPRNNTLTSFILSHYQPLALNSVTVPTEQEKSHQTSFSLSHIEDTVNSSVLSVESMIQELEECSPGLDRTPTKLESPTIAFECDLSVSSSQETEDEDYLSISEVLPRSSFFNELESAMEAVISAKALQDAKQSALRREAFTQALELFQSTGSSFQAEESDSGNETERGYVKTHGLSQGVIDSTASTPTNSTRSPVLRVKKPLVGILKKRSRFCEN